eukprot:TRINITY_DN15634_c0_g1_i1.p1 TRINITY_DN15634_c0_g1~~TRINITY_DN15634_c0_g1_i1.p1  ORF type:complete len:517 (+),score=156.41 TRINITY_DN15634_c0_g1_i1:48-1553(+)
MGKAPIDVKSKAALKPGAISQAPEWSMSRCADDDMQGFKTVKKKGGGAKANPHVGQWNPAPVSSKPAEQKFVPQEYVVGSSAPAAPQKKQNKQNKPQHQKPKAEKPKTSWDEPDEDAGWATVGTGVKASSAPKKQVQREHEKSDKQLKNEATWKKKNAINAHNAQVVGAVSLNAEEEKKLQQKQAKEAKKRMQELTKQHQQKQAAATHTDPNEGFQTVTKSGAKAKKVKSIEHFGATTAFSGLAKQQPQHKKLPKAQKERVVEQISVEEQQAIIAKHRAELTAKPTEAVVEFRIEIQGKWYNIGSLLATNNFEHAPKLVAVAAAQEKVIGGFFVTSDSKAWANENTVDELWMSTSYLTGLTKLLTNKEPVSITPYWAAEKGGKDASTTMSINKTSLQKDCFPSMTLVHCQKQATALQELQVSIHQFVDALVKEARVLETFCERVVEAADKLQETKKWQGKGKSQQLKDLVSKLPSKIDSLVSNLEFAAKDFVEEHPLPVEE